MEAATLNVKPGHSFFDARASSLRQHPSQSKWETCFIKSSWTMVSARSMTFFTVWALLPMSCMALVAPTFQARMRAPASFSPSFLCRHKKTIQLIELGGLLTAPRLESLKLSKHWSLNELNSRLRIRMRRMDSQILGEIFLMSTSSSMISVSKKCRVATRALPLWFEIASGGIGKSLPSAHGAFMFFTPLSRILHSSPEHVMIGSPSETKPSVRKWSSKAMAVLRRVGSRGENSGLNASASGCTAMGAGALDEDTGKGKDAS